VRAELVGDGLTAVVEHVDERDRCPLGDELPGDGGAGPAGSAGDQRGLASEALPHRHARPSTPA
jgi:hypothetical protein